MSDSTIPTQPMQEPVQPTITQSQDSVTQNQSVSQILGMPSDDELCKMLVTAADEGVHENIRTVVKIMTGYVEKAKEVVKELVDFDPVNGLSLRMTVATGDVTLAHFIDKQNFIIKGAASMLMKRVNASTFTEFITKMKHSPDPTDKSQTITTTTNILVKFFEKIGAKYKIAETPESIRAKVEDLFNQVA